MIDWSKPIEGVDVEGVRYPARVLCTDRMNDSNTPVVLLIREESGVEFLHRATLDGNIPSTQFSVRNVPTKFKREFWLVHYKQQSNGACNPPWATWTKPSKHLNRVLLDGAVAVTDHVVEFEEGEGLPK